jgi:hypothetical protein
MLEETYAHPALNEIVSREGNTLCFDCGTENPKWASINNGILLCLKCAGIHRGFGLQISTIRSLQVDSWTEKQVKYLSQGGNLRFKNFLAEYKIEPSSSIELKYKSKATEYYRNLLRNEVEKIFDEKFVGNNIPKPDLDSGIQIIEIKQNDKEINNQFYIGSDNQKQKQSDNSFFGSVGSFFKDAVDTVSKNLNEVKFSETIINAGNAMIDFAKNGGEYIINKTKEAVNSETMQNIKKGAESGFNTFVEKSKILLNIDQQEINPNSQQNPGIDAYYNSINLANNQLNPNNAYGNNMNNIMNNNRNENINLTAEKAKKENNDIE